MDWSPSCVRYGLKRLRTRGKSSDIECMYPKKIYINGPRIGTVKTRNTVVAFINQHLEDGGLLFFYLSVSSTKPKRHANVLMLDLRNGTYSIFDPRGLEFGWEKFPDSLSAIDKWLHTTFKFRFSPLQWELRPQVTVMEKSRRNRGLCSFWCLWWISRTIALGRPPKKILKRHWHDLYRLLS